MDTIASLVDTLLLQLAWTSIQATLLIGLLWLLGRALPRLPAPTRCLLWWLLGAQLLVGLAWQTPVTLPLLPASVTTTIMQTAQVIHVDAQTTSAASPIAATLTPASRAGHALSWREALVALWLAGLFMQLAFVARQWERTRRIRRRSKPLDDPDLQALCADHAQRLGLRHCPELRVSDAIDSPQVTGLWRPTVLLPAQTTLTSAEQAMALAHELAHVRRGDLWLGWVPALAKGLFFFHPLVRLAVREYALHREAACDGQALRLQATAPRDYGHLLIHLGVARPASAGLAGVASPSFQQLKRRLAMLQHAASAMPRTRDWLLVALIALAFVMPYRIVAASPQTSPARHVAETSGLVFIKPPPPPPAVHSQQASAHHDAVRGATPRCLPAADNIGFCGANFLWYAQPANPNQGVVLFDRHRVIIHGTHADVVAAKHVYEPDTSALWFRRGDNAWVTHNDAVIEHARRIYEPTLQRMQQSDLLSDQANALTDKDWALTSQQTAFTQKQAVLSQQRAALARKRASLAQQRTLLLQKTIALRSESREGAAKTASADMDAARKTLTTRQHALDAQQQALNAQYTRLAQQRAAMDAKIDGKRQALATRRAELAKQRNAVAQYRKQVANHARHAMQKLLDDVLAKGLAKPASHD